MRIYLGITGTGGKVLGSFEVGNIYKYTYDILNSYYVYHYLGSSKDFEYHNNIGCTGQQYAIEIKDFIDEDFCCDTKNKNIRHRIYTRWPYFSLIERLPQSFQYIVDPSNGEKAILMPIHQEWFDKIKSGEKKFEFRNKLPNALKGEE